MKLAGLIVMIALAGPAAAGAGAPSEPAVDAPQLAALGPYRVGVRTPVLAPSPGLDRAIPVEVWYPAAPRAGATRATYVDSLPGESAGDIARFTVPGIAVRAAPPDRTHAPYPLVVLSHGYSGTPVAMTWLAENLASKGYVVVAPHHLDPPITDPSKFGGPLARRPLDIAAVEAAAERAQPLGDPALAGMIDAARVALVGYSMGGYGALTVAGAELDPASPTAAAAPALAPWRRGGSKAGSLRPAGLRAVVAIAPAGMRFGAWGAAGLGALRTPLLLIGGDQDRTVGFADGIAPVFAQAVHAPRWFLIFDEGGHSIGMNPAPPGMRVKLWDQDWFEDPVWRKDRAIGVELHFITAFLDRWVKNDVDRASFLELATPRSDDGVWPGDGQGEPWGRVSPGTGGITVWKGFQRAHAAGLEWRHLEAAGPGL